MIGHLDSEEQPWRRWDEAAGEPAIDSSLRAVYEQLDAEIAERGPTCWISGRCCQFDAYGHRLYVTGLEIAWFLRQLDAMSVQRLHSAALPEADGCPFQVKGLCGVHPVRPLGCRIFFCDPNAQDWQNPVYERYLTELRQLHEAHGLPYRYMEWRNGLAEARAALLG